MEGVCSAQVQAQTSTAEDARRKDRPSICRQPWPILISTWPREVEEVLPQAEGVHRRDERPAGGEHRRDRPENRERGGQQAHRRADEVIHALALERVQPHAGEIAAREAAKRF